MLRKISVLELSKKLGVIALALAAMIFASTSAHAATKNWNITGTGDWSVATNWDTGATPVAADIVYINNGGTANVLQSNAVCDTLHLGDGGATLSGTLQISQNGTLALKNLVKGAGTATINFGGGTLKTNAGFNCSLPMNLTGIGGAAIIDTNGYSPTLSASLSGVGGLTKLGNSTLTLGATNTFSGDTTISAGSIVLVNVEGTNALQNSTLNLSGGTLSIKCGNSTTIFVNLGGLAGTQTLTLTRSDISMAVGVSVGSNNQSTQFSGNIVGLGPFKKVGTGKLTLTGANTYSGTTAVTSGVLQVKTPGSLPGYNNLSSVKVTVSSGATLAVNAGGSGEWSSTNIKDLLTYSTFSSGSTLGIDTTGGDSSYEYAIGGDKNLTKLGTGNLTLTGELNYSGTTKIDDGTLTIASTSANLHNIVGSGSLVVGDGLHDAQLSATSICVDSLTISGPSPIVPVPEPSTIALLATALGTCLYWICRKR